MSIPASQIDDSVTSSWARGIPAKDIDSVWFHVKPILERALAYQPRFNAEDIRQLLIAGRAQLFLAGRTACVTEIKEFPRMKVLNIFLAAGDMPTRYLADLEHWARSIGCAEIEESGRPGWTRVLNNLGYEQRGITMVKRLT